MQPSPDHSVASSDREVVAIVDRDNRVTGSSTRGEMRRRNLIHRACYVLVFHPHGELFVQKRTMTKDVYPGYHDITAGGVVLAGESYEESAQRELAEELGVTDAPLEPLFDHYFEDSANRVWGWVFRCITDAPLTLQPEEVESGEFLEVEEILRRAGGEAYTPDGLEILKRYLADGGRT